MDTCTRSVDKYVRSVTIDESVSNIFRCSDGMYSKNYLQLQMNKDEWFRQCNSIMQKYLKPWSLTEEQYRDRILKSEYTDNMAWTGIQSS